MSRLYFARIQDAGWSIGIGLVAQSGGAGCRCLIGMAYLYRLKLGFVFDSLCSIHSPRAMERARANLQKAIDDTGIPAPVEIVKAGHPMHTAVVEALKKNANAS